MSPVMTWGDLGAQYDGPHATPERRAEGPYFLNIASLSSGRLNLSASDHLSDDDFRRWSRRVAPQAHDLLFSYETRLGEAALMPVGVDACLGRRMALLRPDTRLVDPRFLLYYFLSPRFQRTIAERTIHGATVPRISLLDMPTWPVEEPELSTQCGIAEVLGALDDKIAANTTVVVRSADLIDASLRQQLLRDEPVAVPLSSLAHFVNGKAFTKGASGTGRVVIRIAELTFGIGPSTVYNDLHVADEHVARPGDLLFAWSGSLTVHRWSRDEGIINQHIFKVIPKESYPMWLVHNALKRKLSDFKSIAADKATTMGHIQRRHLDEAVLVPSKHAIERRMGPSPRSGSAPSRPKSSRLCWPVLGTSCCRC